MLKGELICMQYGFDCIDDLYAIDAINANYWKSYWDFFNTVKTNKQTQQTKKNNPLALAAVYIL